MKNFRLVIFAATLLPLSAVQANTSEGFRAIVSAQPAPTVLDSSEKQAFTAIFQAIKAQNWVEAEKLIDKAPQGPMAAMARAEYYLAPNSPKVDAERLQTLLQSAP